MALEEFCQICRRTCLEPVSAIPAAIKCIQQTERIIYAWTVRAEMIAVIILLQLKAGLLIALTVPFCQIAYVFFKIVCQLLSADAADGRVLFIHRNVYKIIKVAEYTYLAEFGHPCEHGKTDISVH